MSTARRSSFLLSASFALAVVGIACGDSGTGLPTDAGTGGNGGGSGGAAGGGAGAGGSGGAGGGAGSTDGPANTDGGPRDGGGDRMGAPDGFMTDAPPPSPGKVACGSDACDTATQQCCSMFSGGGGGGSMSCIPKGTPCMGLAAGCDEKGDCKSGQVCCQSLGGPGPGGFMPPASMCVPEKDCSGMGTAQLCSSDADCPASASKCCSYGAMMMSISACRSGC